MRVLKHCLLQHHRNLASCLVLILASGSLYVATLAPTVTSEDSGELIAAAHHWGIAHPPGYPLWTILCGLFIRIVPFGNVAWQANLFSAVCSSVSTILLCAMLLSCGVRRSAAMAAALVWAFSGTLWSQSVITEVYGLNALLCSLLIWAFVKWHHSQEKRWLLWASLFFGLGMSNHHTIAFVALALGVWALTLKPALLKDWKLIGLSLAAFVLGLMPYLYLPIRARANPPMNWGNPATASTFLEHVSRAQYGSTAPLRVREGRSVARFWRQSAYLTGVLARDLTLPIMLASLGGLLLLLWRRNPLGWMVMLLFLSCGILFLLVSNIDLDRTFRFAMKVFFIPLSLVLAMSLAFALDGLAARIERHVRGRTRAMIGACVLLVPLLPAISNYRHCDYSNYWYAADHAKNMLASMLPDAIIFPTGDHNTFPLMYLTMVEGVRPDVSIADKYGYVDPALIDSIAEQSGQSVRLTSEQDRQEFIIRHARRPVYCTTKTKPPVENADFLPVGVVYHLLPHGKPLDQDSAWKEIRYQNIEEGPSVQDLGASHILADYYFFTALNELRKGQLETALASFRQSAAPAHGIKENANNIGSALAEHGLADDAVGYFEDARDLDEHYLTPRRNLVRIYEQQERWAQVEELLQEIILITPDDPRPFARLGFIAAELNEDPKQARHWWQESLRRDPNQPRINEALKDLDGPKEKP